MKNETLTGVFLRIAHTKDVKEFYFTPIHRFFSTRGVPGITPVWEKLLYKKGIKTPMDLVFILREKVCGTYIPMRDRVMLLARYLVKLGVHRPRDVYTAAVSITLVEGRAPVNGRIAL